MGVAGGAPTSFGPDRGGCLTIFARLLRVARADLGDGGRPKDAYTAVVFEGGFRCLQPADAALPSFGGGPPDHTLLAASMISIWSEATWTTSRTAGLQPGGPSKGWGGQNRLPWPTIG